MKNKTDFWIAGTGFSRGIGAELAKKLHEKGYRILHIGRNECPYQDEFLFCDLSQPLSAECIAQMRSSLENKILCGFVYGAGMMPDLICGDSAQEKENFWKSYRVAMQVNYFSCVELSCEAIPFLLKSKRESFLHVPFLAHISSLAAVDPLPNLEYYGITKLAALKHFSYLAKQYDFTEMLCLAIHPGSVLTDIFNNLLKKEHVSLPLFPVLQNAIESKKVILPERSAELIVNFLCDNGEKDTRIAAHGKLYAADTQQIYEEEKCT